MTSAVRKGRVLAKFCPKEGRLRESGTDKGREGVQNPENLADVICVCPLTTPIALKTLQVCCVDMFIKKGS